MASHIRQSSILSYNYYNIMTWKNEKSWKKKDTALE